MALLPDVYKLGLPKFRLVEHLETSGRTIDDPGGLLQQLKQVGAGMQT